MGILTSVGEVYVEELDGAFYIRVNYSTPKAEQMTWDEFRRFWILDRYLNGQLEYVLHDFDGHQFSIDKRRKL